MVLRDGAEVEGGIFLNDGQALGPYLGSRKGGWVNLVAASWLVPVEEAVNHAVLQADHILYCYATEGDIPVHTVQGVVSVRHIEVTLSNDGRIRGSLAIADRQRRPAPIRCRAPWSRGRRAPCRARRAPRHD